MMEYRETEDGIEWLKDGEVVATYHDHETYLKSNPDWELGDLYDGDNIIPHTYAVLPSSDEANLKIRWSLRLRWWFQRMIAKIKKLIRGLVNDG